MIQSGVYRFENIDELAHHLLVDMLNGYYQNRKQAARSYWNASPKDSSHDLYEYMASSAIVIHEID